MNQYFFDVKDVARILDIAEPTAYKIIQKLNKELQAEGYKIIHGKVSIKFFNERLMPNC